MYGCVNAIRQFEPFSEPSGNVSVQEIVMNRKGELKLNVALSSPFQKVRQSLLDNYFGIWKSIKPLRNSKSWGRSITTRDQYLARCTKNTTSIPISVKCFRSVFFSLSSPPNVIPQLYTSLHALSIKKQWLCSSRNCLTWGTLDCYAI